ncbi:MAG: hypothetical protein JJT75_01035 [Opitutales bacterium]|nr:hypothetical protein [Opitutales bacterium]MCH8540406.1 hypothetical protein [Opitutales bacterium]
MKSAYELAMERLQKEDPSQSALTDSQKEELKSLDQKYQAKVAEKEVFLQGQINKARANRDQGEVQALEKQLQNERTRLEEEREEAKERVRKQ